MITEVDQPRGYKNLSKKVLESKLKTAEWNKRCILAASHVTAEKMADVPIDSSYQC